MYAVMELRTNDQGIMTIVDPIFKTDNDVYAQSKVYDLASKAVASSVYVHTILCINEHGQNCFNTPLWFEHIPETEPVVTPSE